MASDLVRVNNVDTCAVCRYSAKDHPNPRLFLRALWYGRVPEDGPQEGHEAVWDAGMKNRPYMEERLKPRARAVIFKTTESLSIKTSQRVYIRWYGSSKPRERSIHRPTTFSQASGAASKNPSGRASITQTDSESSI